MVAMTIAIHGGIHGAVMAKKHRTVTAGSLCANLCMSTACQTVVKVDSHCDVTHRFVDYRTTSSWTLKPSPYSFLEPEVSMFGRRGKDGKNTHCHDQGMTATFAKGCP